MVKNKLVIPFVKWVGGKRQLLDEIIPLLPKHFTTYCQPFLGGGAVLFSIQPSKAIVSDLNIDLITAYEVIRDDIEALIESLKKHENTTEYFYAVRDMDRDKTSYQALSRIEKASRLIYLNKTCFNGLFRVNSSGEFNSPFGHYKNPKGEIAYTLIRKTKVSLLELSPPLKEKQPIEKLRRKSLRIWLYPFLIGHRFQNPHWLLRTL